MTKDNVCYQSYVNILKEELVPAMGCTEPIAIAYAAASAVKALGTMPDRVRISVSNNIVKNVKSVIVPNTGGQKGIKAAAAAGIVAGRADKVLEVISVVSDEQKKEIAHFLETCQIDLEPSESDHVFDIEIVVYKGDDSARVHICDFHTNIVLIKRNDEVLFESRTTAPEMETGGDRELLNVQEIIDFAETVDLDDIRDTIARQIAYNTAISDEGLKNPYGANIGKTLLKTYGDDVIVRAKARAAAGSDARMSGCELPVIINSGSGNQGMTASLPVIEYAAELNVSEEKLYRTLVLSNLLTIHLKTGIGRLSAYCGAISAGCAAGAAIAYLNGGDYKTVAHTLVNSLAIVSGIVCDGAKPSCAAKIAYAVDAGIMGWKMYQNGQQFYDGDGIVKKGVENTIHNVSRLGCEGMRSTDEEIVKIMTGN